MDFQYLNKFSFLMFSLPELLQSSQTSSRAPRGLPELPQPLESTPPQDSPFSGNVQSEKLIILLRTMQLDFFRNLSPPAPQSSQSSPRALPELSQSSPRALPELSPDLPRLWKVLVMLMGMGMGIVMLWCPLDSRILFFFVLDTWDIYSIGSFFLRVLWSLQ